MQGAIPLILSNVVWGGCQWASFSFVAKQLGMNVVGSYALALAITSPIFLLFSMNIRTLISISDNARFSDFDYLIARYFFSFVAFALVAVFSLFFERRDGELMLVLGAVKALETLSEAYYGWMQREEKFNQIFLFRAGRCLVGLLAFYFALTIGWGIVGALLGQFVIYTLGTIAESRITWNFKSSTLGLRKIFHVGLVAIPLGLVALIDSLSNNSPRYFLGWMSGKEDVGIYSALAYFFFAGGAVLSAVSALVTPRLAQAHNEGNDQEFFEILKSVISKSLVLFAVAIIGFSIFGRSLLRLLYNPGMQEYVFEGLIVLSAMGVWFLATLLGCGLIARGQYKSQLAAHVVMCVVIGVCSAVLIPIFRVGGAALSILIMMIFRAVFSWIVLRYRDSTLPAESPIC